KAHDLITSPAYVVIKAADVFHTKTTHPNEMWQTDFTYFKIIGLRNPREVGHGFHGNVGSHSTGSWAVIPRERGHPL
ncbi:MAG: hypothetical protein ABI040_10110, partial [Rhodoferax sp.]